MSKSTTKLVVLLLMTALIIAESLYFGGHAVAGFQELRARRAFSRNEFSLAWEAYSKAAGLCEDCASLEQDMLDLLVFVLVQREAGIDMEFPLSPAESESLARNMVARLLRELPTDARAWARDAELKLYAARQSRRDARLDISLLSEDPLENLMEEERSALESLRTAAALEPNNYFYHDLLVSFFLGIGTSGEAAQHVRRAIAAYPSLEAHAYLDETDIPPEVIEAAIDGFTDAISRISLIPVPYVAIDAGYLLMQQGDLERAIEFLQRGVAQAPNLFSGRYRLGQALLRINDFRSAQEQLQKAIELRPSIAPAYYYLGLTNEALGDLPAAIDALILARQKQPQSLRFRHKLGELLEAAGRLDEAERQFTAAANLFPESAAALQSLMAFHLRRGDRAAALGVCKRLPAPEHEGQFSSERCAALVEGQP